MALPNDTKRKAMNAITHRETAEHMRLLNAKAQLRGYKHAIGQALPAGLKKQMMSAVAGVETVAQVGVIKATGGVAIYAAHIRQMDRANRQGREVKTPDKPYYKRSEGFLKD